MTMEMSKEMKDYDKRENVDLEDIQKKYKRNKWLSDKLECDELRKKFACVLANVSISLNEMN